MGGGCGGFEPLKCSKERVRSAESGGSELHRQARSGEVEARRVSGRRKMRPEKQICKKRGRKINGNKI
jgi:hypothetical protein